MKQYADASVGPGRLLGTSVPQGLACGVPLRVGHQRARLRHSWLPANVGQRSRDPVKPRTVQKLAGVSRAAVTGANGTRISPSEPL